ncbi:unnamed protein product [Hydatigera taeniaeformis]|uniref:Uncharacterized protein n=1 Tax=Hydatigena taeniaeformis TaxID=6205 RepID=A0A0R3WMU4_HYDTA|nr:unnamed protein product [Hydatigera taeniaeformis]
MQWRSLEIVQLEWAKGSDGILVMVVRCSSQCVTSTNGKAGEEGVPGGRTRAMRRVKNQSERSALLCSALLCTAPGIAKIDS